ncbi:ABC transporter permease [Pseudooceanicola atlanticus]|jgi:ribose transport system permease protein|uniref:ABC transporter permease n=1 Tax=Pseudooceanicola atlanticus TaxID=1461694 RepID=A0A0A0EH15_9RHOB|nr:ABC transporter permease [Pseudooceanicola atlanticus]KGM49353.1 ABC transporter permease [Pseudooceanicola atlanticus]
MSTRKVIEMYGTALAGLGLFVFLSIFANNFLSSANLFNVLKQVSFLSMLAFGFTFALITSELDLAFANVCSLAAVVIGFLISTDVAWPLAVAAGVATGFLAGLLNGLLVTVAKVPSLISTLGTASIANGLAFMITGGVAFVGRWDPNFLFLGRGKLGPIPVIILFTLVLFLIVLTLSTQTRTGVHLQATGENEEAARRSGIDTRRAKIIGLVLSGLAAGITAVFLVANLSSAAPQMAGDFLLNGIAATLLGMTMFTPAKPNILGTFVGSLIIVMLSNGLVLLGAQYYIQDIMLGIIIILSVAVSASVLKRAAFAL